MHKHLAATNWQEQFVPRTYSNLSVCTRRDRLGVELRRLAAGRLGPPMRIHRQFVSTRRILAAATKARQLGATRKWLADEPGWWRSRGLGRPGNDVIPIGPWDRELAVTFDVQIRPRTPVKAGHGCLHPLPRHSIQRGWSGPWNNSRQRGRGVSDSSTISA